MIYNVVLVSAVQQSDPVIHMYTFFFIFFSIKSDELLSENYVTTCSVWFHFCENKCVLECSSKMSGKISEVWLCLLLGDGYGKGLGEYVSGWSFLLFLLYKLFIYVYEIHK